MSDKAKEDFLKNVKKEINHKVKIENKVLEELKKEKKELEQSIDGYSLYYERLEKFIMDSMQDFSQNEEDLPKYFRSNINEVYNNYVQIKKDAKDEIDELTKYYNHCKKEETSTKRTLKFYQSQYMDSDFYEDCQPLVTVYQEKIETCQENQELTKETIKQLSKIEKKLEKW